ncbi:50S ribosomal protein L32 [Desulfallas sp. Bu1-1]|jgi:large subunit ribosomal protein L32|uniref:50S ribosomal protein L32 n=1 Tax=Desulfallas sp. Bu1-1 TaxID=2787620 RepID=UPI00189D2626|nr:50S ribosomal protein L32 [Desulfallas sp. Bu1-1]MBF7083569.1 50S ribosomal protein L32 [Desulfallas sp. Bu1-1]
MGVPKRKRSKQRNRQRRAQQKIEAPKLVECPQCHELIVPHRACAECGYYKGRKAVAVK